MTKQLPIWPSLMRISLEPEGRTRPCEGAHPGVDRAHDRSRLHGSRGDDGGRDGRPSARAIRADDGGGGFAAGAVCPGRGPGRRPAPAPRRHVRSRSRSVLRLQGLARPHRAAVALRVLRLRDGCRSGGIPVCRDRPFNPDRGGGFPKDRGDLGRRCPATSIDELPGWHGGPGGRAADRHARRA